MRPHCQHRHYQRTTGAITQAQYCRNHHSRYKRYQHRWFADAIVNTNSRITNKPSLSAIIRTTRNTAPHTMGSPHTSVRTTIDTLIIGVANLAIRAATGVTATIANVTAAQLNTAVGDAKTSLARIAGCSRHKTLRKLRRIVDLRATGVGTRPSKTVCAHFTSTAATGAAAAIVCAAGPASAGRLADR